MMVFMLPSSAQETDYRSITPPNGKSLVYIVRPSIYGFAVGFKVSVNGQYLGDTHGKSYLYCILNPGDQTITNSAENNTSVTLRTEPDKTYFLKQKVETGLLTARAELELLNETDGRKALMKCGLSKSNTYGNNLNNIPSTRETVPAQSTSEESIESVKAEVKNDSLIISFDLNNLIKIQSLWVEIRTADGKKIINNSLDTKIWKTVAAVPNSKIVWAYAIDKADIAGQDINIDVKANVFDEVPAPVVAIPQPIKEKPKEVAKYPLFRPGIEITAGQDNFFGSDHFTGNATFTLEYIVKPSWSVLSGVGWQGTDLGGSTQVENWKVGYSSIIIPLTLEYKRNYGRWFRYYAGGGIQNRILMEEHDNYLNIGQGLKRYIFGAKAEAGIEIRSLRFGLTYVSDVTSYSVFNEKISYLGLTLGWRFGGSKAYIK